VHFPLHPETPAEGVTLEKLFSGRDVDMDGMHNRMQGLMDEEGLPYNRRSHTYNSRLAQELGAWADTQEGGNDIHEALFKAYFVDGRNIGDRDILVEIAGAVGLDAAAALGVLESRSFKDRIDADWSKSRQYGITGVPTYVAAGQGVVGAQPYEVLAQLMDSAEAEPRGD
jgi:predicted DsbA family dithiol-disulfide isomerase|tara:strand:- start:1327 stop:1836 length:510 start_codon:yes stop_codon:yes gene_type:complete